MSDRPWTGLDRVEARLVGETHHLPRRPPSPVVTLVTTAARGGVLWFAWCVREAVRPGGDRRLARRAAASVGVALVMAEALKQLLPARWRPERPGGPARRELPECPRSSSFPSAHAATSAAFVTTVLAHDRRRGALVLPAAVTAVYGRVRTRVHWPSDVVAGLVIGVATARLTTYEGGTSR